MTYSELENNLSFIDALKLTAILDYRLFKEKQERLKSQKEQESNG